MGGEKTKLNIPYNGSTGQKHIGMIENDKMEVESNEGVVGRDR